ncbi:MAG: PAS domain-containing protein [Alphaproteobacteria bacterium]|nr:PAS domain-containing protein [Alphaproteobacteria bacterium]
MLRTSPNGDTFAVRRVCTRDDVSCERLARIFDYWHNKARGRIAPSREEISPAELRADLPWVWLADVLDGGDDFGFRLAGEQLRRFLGPTSATRLSECQQSPFFNNAGRVFRRCVEIREPLMVGPNTSTYESKSFLTTSVLVLPLSSNGIDISMLFGAFEASFFPIQ